MRRNEMGWDGEQIWRDTITNSQTAKMFNRSSRVEPRYRAIGLLD